MNPEPTDIDAAGREQLDAVEGLEGHGHEIVRYRDERGGSTDLSQLDEVPGPTGRVTAAVRRQLRIGR
jgi:competence protein ComEA